MILDTTLHACTHPRQVIDKRLQDGHPARLEVRTDCSASKLSSSAAKQFVEKLRDVHLNLASMRKATIQALDRSQPGLPLKKGRPAP